MNKKNLLRSSFEHYYFYTNRNGKLSKKLKISKTDLHKF